MKKPYFLVMILLVVMSGVGYSQEITETISFKELVANVQESLGHIEDFVADIKIELVENKRTNITRLQVKASATHGLARLVFTEPNALAGQIIVINGQANEIQVFMPVVQQIMISPMETVGTDLGLGVDVIDLNSIFDFSSVTGTIEEVVETERGLNYLVKLVELGDETQYVWINQDFIPFKLAIYEGERYLGALFFDDLEINQRLSIEELESLPKATKINF